MFRPKFDVRAPEPLSWPRACVACGTTLASRLESGQTFHHVLKAKERSMHPSVFGMRTQTVSSRANAVIHVCDKCLQAYKEDKNRYTARKSANRRNIRLLTIGSLAIPLLALPTATYLGGWVIPVPSTISLTVFLPAFLAGWIGYFLVSMLKIREGPRTKPPKTPFHNHIRLSADGTLLLTNYAFLSTFARVNPKIKATRVSFPKEVENQLSRGSECMWGAFLSVSLAILSIVLSSFVMFLS